MTAPAACDVYEWGVRCGRPHAWVFWYECVLGHGHGVPVDVCTGHALAAGWDGTCGVCARAGETVRARLVRKEQATGAR